MWCTFGNNWLPKQVLYSKLVQGKCLQFKTRKRNKDYLEGTLKEVNIDVDTWENLASDRNQWRNLIASGDNNIETKYVVYCQLKHAAKCIEDFQKQDQSNP